MACGKDNTPRITQQVTQITKTLAPATPEFQLLAGFRGSCVTFSDLDKRNPRTLIVDRTHARLGHYNKRTKRFYEVISKGEWTTAPFTIDPEDPKAQAIGKHTAIYLGGFISSRTPEHIENLINGGYFDNLTVNHMTGNVNDDMYLEYTSEKQNNLHGKVLKRLADLFAGTTLTYIPEDAKRKGKAVDRPALKYPLSIKEITHVYREINAKHLIPRPIKIDPTTIKKFEKEAVDLIAKEIAPVWRNAHHYVYKHPEANYPMHDDLKYKHQRRAVLSALEAVKSMQSEEYHAEYNYLRFEEQISKIESAEALKLSA